jgi:hypothetical protein
MEPQPRLPRCTAVIEQETTMERLAQTGRPQTGSPDAGDAIGRNLRLVFRTDRNGPAPAALAALLDRLAAAKGGPASAADGAASGRDM